MSANTSAAIINSVLAISCAACVVGLAALDAEWGYGFLMLLGMVSTKHKD